MATQPLDLSDPDLWGGETDFAGTITVGAGSPPTATGTSDAHVDEFTPPDDDETVFDGRISISDSTILNTRPGDRIIVRVRLTYSGDLGNKAALRIRAEQYSPT